MPRINYIPLMGDGERGSRYYILCVCVFLSYFLGFFMTCDKSCGVCRRHSRLDRQSQHDLYTGREASFIIKPFDALIYIYIQF